MKWLELNNIEAERTFNELEGKEPEKYISIQDEEYRKIRKEIYSAFLDIMMELGISNYEDSEKYAYDVGYRFGIKLFVLLKKYGMNRYIASKDGVWKYLQLKIFPDLVYYRWRYAEDRYFKLNRRLWLKTIWWYAFLAWRKDEDYTKKILEGNTTDTILQLVERTGNYGYRVELYNEILFQKYNCNIKDQDIFRRILILNTMRVKIIDPYLYRDGISGYVKDLLIDSNAITKEEL